MWPLSPGHGNEARVDVGGPQSFALIDPTGVRNMRSSVRASEKLYMKALVRVSEILYMKSLVRVSEI